MYFTSVLFFIFCVNYINYIKSVIISNFHSVEQLNVNKYIGNWYQIYGSPTNYIFQGYGKCLTAEYGLLENGNVSVINSQLNIDNVLEQISGYAYYTNTSEPGKLTVHLEGVPVDSPYWVVKLGEVIGNQYQYSIISVPSSISLWVIARDIDNFYQKYDKEVKQYLDEHNFNYKPIVQDNSCEYFFKYSLNRYIRHII